MIDYAQLRDAKLAIISQTAKEKPRKAMSCPMVWLNRNLSLGKHNGLYFAFWNPIKVYICIFTLLNACEMVENAYFCS